MIPVIPVISIHVEKKCSSPLRRNPHPRVAASDLGLHCLPLSHLWAARRKNKCVNPEHT